MCMPAAATVGPSASLDGNKGFCNSCFLPMPTRSEQLMKVCVGYGSRTANKSARYAKHQEGPPRS